MNARAWRHGGRIVMARPVLFAITLLHYIAFYMLPLAVGLVMRAIFDRLTGAADAGSGGAWTLVALLAGVEITRLAVIFSAVRFGPKFDFDLEAQLRRNMLAALLGGPPSVLGRYSPGDALGRFRDDAGAVTSFLEGWIDMPGELLLCVGAIAIMLSINVTITLVVVVPLLAIVLVTDRLTGRIQRLRTQSREAGAEVLSFIAELFGAVETLRVAAAEPHVLDQLSRLNESRRRAWIRDSVFDAFIAAFSSNISTLGLGAVLLLAAGAMQRGTFTVGDFALFASYLELATSGPRWVGRLLARRRQADVSLARMTELMGVADPMALTAPSGPDAAGAADTEGEVMEELSIRRLTYRYPGSERGIADVDLEVRRGELVVVTGRVGAGKSTLLRAVVGSLSADEGEIRWNGRTVEHPHRFMRPPRCAFVSQVPVLFSETLKDNILMGLDVSGDRVNDAMRRAVLETDIAELDAGLDTVIGSRGVKLSGGQQKRAAIARALVRSSGLLVLDDVSNSLDIDSERRFWDGITSAPGLTVVAVVHRRGAFRRADRIVVLESGRVESQGTLSDLLETSSVFREIWEAAS